MEIKRFDVHVYAVVRFKVEGIEAATPSQAAQTAEQLLQLRDGNYAVFADGRLSEGEYAEQVESFLVDCLDERGERIGEVRLNSDYVEG